MLRNWFKTSTQEKHDPICTSCGSMIASDDIFCTNCGEKRQIKEIESKLLQLVHNRYFPNF